METEKENTKRKVAITEYQIYLEKFQNYELGMFQL